MLSEEQGGAQGARKYPEAFERVCGMSIVDALRALSDVMDAESFNARDQKRLIAFVQAHDPDGGEDGDASIVARLRNTWGA